MALHRWIFVFLASLISCTVAAQSCYDTSVKSPSPYLNNGGEVIIMTDGTIWQDVSYNYSYAYEYYPSVTICPSAGFMIMNGKKIAIIPVNGGASAPQGRKAPEASSSEVIESRIDGEFTGWEGETVFKLTNGQIWQQSGYAYRYHYAYSPSVLIVRTSVGYVMQVGGLNSRINVRRLR